MIQSTLSRILKEAAVAAAPGLGVQADDVPDPEVTRPKAREHGDWATNLALVLAPRAGRPPRQVAEAVLANLAAPGVVARAEVAGPGFINLFLGHGWLHDALERIMEEGPRYGRRPPTGVRVQVEFVSANPTGPLHVGTARNGAIGDSLASVLAAAGHEVEREYYFNDAAQDHQIELFGESVEARYLQRFGVEAEVPEGGYQGSYVADLAARIADAQGDTLVAADPEERRRRILAETVERNMADIKATLARFRVRFDTYFSERTLHETGAIAGAIDRLRAAGFVYEADGAVWFRSTAYGDDKDRVLIRSTGAPTYFAADCAYLLEKVGRGFDRLIYVWGADHHGDMARMHGAARALGIDPKRIWILLYQLVTLYRGGEPVRMSKRTGELVSLDELIDEVGADAARYTLLTRSADSPLDFDIEAVTRQSLDNPVYYVQYAHARIASLLRYAADQGVDRIPWREVDRSRLREDAELELLRELSELPEVLQVAAEGLAPHRLTRYAEQVAAAFHRFYAECRVITEDEALSQARLCLIDGVRQVLATTLELIGVSAPESMERLGGDDA